jgi:hypothetical protein
MVGSFMAVWVTARCKNGELFDFKFIRHTEGYSVDNNKIEPKPDKPVVAKRKSRFIGEVKIEDLLFRFALSFQFKSIAFLSEP